MKRLVLGLLLASLTLGISLAAGAVPYLQDPNVIYSANEAGTDAWVLIYNNYNDGLTVNAAYLTGYASFRILAAGSFYQQLGGNPVALRAQSATVPTVLNDIAQSLNKMHRTPLGAEIGPGGYVVLHLQPTGSGTTVKLFEAKLIFLQIF